MVVICFKFSNFAYANTVVCGLFQRSKALLFALNLVTLLMQIQFHNVEKMPVIVVICFKFSNFAYANTVQNIILITSILLLFALNLVTLLMQIQLVIWRS